MDAPNLVPPDHVSDDDSKVDDDGSYKGDDFQNPVPSILKHGNYVSDDKVSDDDGSQEAAIQMDPEGHDAVADENAVNE